ncbi:hypothetical protein JXA84_08215 [candidate division WOR-3 bacterium]|nr:hypothetical protein [candidate division WOR-3 bacterium]
MNKIGVWKKKLGGFPKNHEEFLKVYAAMGTTPQGASACLIVALMFFSKNKDEGLKMLASVVDPSRTVKKQGAIPELFQSDLRFISMQSTGKEYMFNSYAVGTDPKNGYKIEKMPIEFEFSSNKYSEAMGDCRFKLFVKCSGASTPRPITLSKQDDGYWKALEYSSLLLDVQKPLQ